MSNYKIIIKGLVFTVFVLLLVKADNNTYVYAAEIELDGNVNEASWKLWF